MLHDSQPTVVLHTQRTPVSAEVAGTSQRIWLDQPQAWSGLSGAALTVPASALRSSHLAYVIYTSGSTGRPKGVMNAHRGVVNRLLWMQEAYGLQPGEAVLQKTACSFDVSVWEFFWPVPSWCWRGRAGIGIRLICAR
jgi:non-ribosomal peptide synthetase component F